MILDEKVRYIKKAKDQNKLIIFVGAGVSKNSNLPDWEQLIKVFINKLNYPISEGEKLSSDEYLKIPQYYYNIHGGEEYKKVIKDKLDVERQPNDIHELIFKLNPKHIITTNYDRLLENTIIEQRMLFDVISKDKDLLDSKKSNYIIKMHGDIKELDDIVLKENDYLNYSQNHILIETYIKSLLVSNTFLFIGYSLNDYNLKQIISWVDHLAKSYTDIKDRPKNFIIQEVNEEYIGFIEDYYEKNNIFIINPKEIDNKYIEGIPTRLTNEFGKRLYGTLMYIKDYPNSVIDKLYYGCLQLEKLKRISINDLFRVYEFKYSEVLGGDTLYFSNIDANEYIVIKDIIDCKSEKEKIIKKILVKSGIKHICFRRNDEDEVYNLIDSYNQIDDDVDEINKLEIECNYLEIYKRIKLINDKKIKALYFFKLQEFGESMKYIKQLKEETLNGSIYDLLKYKFNLGLLNQLLYHNGKENYDDFRYIYNNIAKKNMCEINFLNNIFNGNKEQQLQLVKLKETHIEKYLKVNNSIYIGDIRHDLYKMMTIVYDYYFYIRENGIYLDYFNDMKKFFEPYIEAILSTYSPKTKRIRTNTVFPDYNEYKNYILNIYDWDIIIKHSNYKKISELLIKYEVKEIEYEEDIEIVKILWNLCQYIKLKLNRFNIEYLKKFVLLLTVINLDKDDVNRVVKILEDVLINREGDLCVYILIEIDKDFNNFINKNSGLINRNSFELIINELFNEKVYKKLEDENRTGVIFRFLNSMNPFSYNLYKNKIDEIIEKNNFKYILGVSKLISMEQKKIISNNIINNLDNMNISEIIGFIFENIIEYNEFIESKIIHNLEIYVSDIAKNPNVRSFPDPLQSTLNKVIVLFLLDKGVNIFKFEKYIEYNNVLEFIINPKEFDYEKIELDNYNWMNIMRNEEYLKIIIEKAKGNINKKLKYNIDNGFANEEQTRLYYKYFE